MVHDEANQYKLPININKKLKVWGLPPLYLVVAIGVSVLVGIFNMYISIVGLSLLYFYSSKFRKEAKRGNPNVLNDLEAKRVSKGYQHLEDKSNVLAKINRNG